MIAVWILLTFVPYSPVNPSTFNPLTTHLFALYTLEPGNLVAPSAVAPDLWPRFYHLGGGCLFNVGSQSPSSSNPPYIPSVIMMLIWLVKELFPPSVFALFHPSLVLGSFPRQPCAQSADYRFPVCMTLRHVLSGADSFQETPSNCTSFSFTPGKVLWTGFMLTVNELISLLGSMGYIGFCTFRFKVLFMQLTTLLA